MVNAALTVFLEYWWIFVLVIAIGVACQYKTWRWLAICVIVLDLGYNFRSEVSDVGEWAISELRPYVDDQRGATKVRKQDGGRPRAQHVDGRELVGRASVIDGDTIEVDGSRIRLHGVDAPESAQNCLAGGTRWPCGRDATRALALQVEGQSVACDERDRDRYGRIVAVCRFGGKDLNAWLVANGWALAYRRYSAAYAGEEASAKAARGGLWRGTFILPWEWRTGVRLESSRGTTQQNESRDDRTASRNAGTCRIKGNIGRDGARIYHVPGGQYYERTRISSSKGERWFCSEAEARSAGWRKSR